MARAVKNSNPGVSKRSRSKKSTEKVIYTMILIIASPDNQSSSDTRSGGGGDGGRGTRGASLFLTTSPEGARGVGTGSGRLVSATVSPRGGAEKLKSFHALFDRNLRISSSSPAKDAVCLDIRASREVCGCAAASESWNSSAMDAAVDP